jgi:preprotein translocase subunit SecE
LHHAPSPSIDSERLVWVQSRVKNIESLLSFGSTIVLIVVIWGMAGGIGKSTMAEAVYHRNYRQLEGHCFFRNVREETEKHGRAHVGEVYKRRKI